jgi:hypothetical protein
VSKERKGGDESIYLVEVIQFAGGKLLSQTQKMVTLVSLCISLIVFSKSMKFSARQNTVQTQHQAAFVQSIMRISAFISCSVCCELQIFAPNKPALFL